MQRGTYDMAKAFWGYHLAADCGACNEQVKSKEAIAEFLKALVKAIDMKAYGEPFLERFATDAPELGGISACQMIETSNICLHATDMTQDLYLDIFSCKPYSNEVALQVVKDFFNPQSIRITYLTRQA